LNGDPILVVAAAAQRWPTVRLLVECGANVDATDRHGKTALSYVLQLLVPHLCSDTSNSARDSNNQDAVTRGLEQTAYIRQTFSLLYRQTKKVSVHDLLPLGGGTASASVLQSLLENSAPRITVDDFKLLSPPVPAYLVDSPDTFSDINADCLGILDLKQANNQTTYFLHGLLYPDRPRSTHALLLILGQSYHILTDGAPTDTLMTASEA
jgi:hypothetical protein